MSDGHVRIEFDYYAGLISKRFRELDDRMSRGAKSLEESFMEWLEDCDVGVDMPRAEVLVDNFVFNGNFVSRNAWESQCSGTTTGDPAWYDFCAEGASIWNSEYALLRDDDGIGHQMDEIDAAVTAALREQNPEKYG
jgi:hypothetical protein